MGGSKRASENILHTCKSQKNRNIVKRQEEKETLFPSEENGVQKKLCFHPKKRGNYFSFG